MDASHVVDEILHEAEGETEEEQQEGEDSLDAKHEKDQKDQNKFQEADSNDVSALVRAEMDELLLLKRVLQAAGALQDVSVIVLGISLAGDEDVSKGDVSWEVGLALPSWLK